MLKHQGNAVWPALRACRPDFLLMNSVLDSVWGGSLPLGGRWKEAGQGPGAQDETAGWKAMSPGVGPGDCSQGNVTYPLDDPVLSSSGVCPG